MNRDEFNAKQEAEGIQNAMKQCAVIQFESGAYFTGFFDGKETAMNLLAHAEFFVIGGRRLSLVREALNVMGAHYQVVIIGRVGALP